MGRKREKKERGKPRKEKREGSLKEVGEGKKRKKGKA